MIRILLSAAAAVTLLAAVGSVAGLIFASRAWLIWLPMLAASGVAFVAIAWMDAVLGHVATIARHAESVADHVRNADRRRESKTRELRDESIRRATGGG